MKLLAMTVVCSMLIATAQAAPKQDDNRLMVKKDIGWLFELP